jgi:hypothetical protein
MISSAGASTALRPFDRAFFGAMLGMKEGGRLTFVKARLSVALRRISPVAQNAKKNAKKWCQNEIERQSQSKNEIGFSITLPLSFVLFLFAPNLFYLYLSLSHQVCTRISCNAYD